MTAPAKFFPGGRLSGAMLRGIAPLSAYKSQSQAVASNAATFVNDDALLLQLAENAVYYFRCKVGYTGNTSGSGDIDLAWSLPSGAVMGYALYGFKGGVATPGFWQTSASISLNSNGTGSPLSAVLRGTVDTAGTAGMMQLTWKQNTSSATATTVLAGSSLLAWQVQ